MKVTDYNIGRDEYLVTKLTCVKNEETHPKEDDKKNGDANEALSTTEHGELIKKCMENMDDDQLDNTIAKSKEQHKTKIEKDKRKRQESKQWKSAGLNYLPTHHQ